MCIAVHFSLLYGSRWWPHLAPWDRHAACACAKPPEGAQKQLSVQHFIFLFRFKTPSHSKTKVPQSLQIQSTEVGNWRTSCSYPENACQQTVQHRAGVSIRKARAKDKRETVAVDLRSANSSEMMWNPQELLANLDNDRVFLCALRIVRSLPSRPPSQPPGSARRLGEKRSGCRRAQRPHPERKDAQPSDELRRANRQ
jgi:hypothetical protein